MKSLTFNYILTQVQDYYVQMRFNDRTKSVQSLYRLFCATYMLRQTKIDGLNTAHDYPKMMLSYLLILAHNVTVNNTSWQLMDGNMYMFNEEWGEASLSALSRCVLGDSMKCAFEHMDKIFRLLPLYRDIKNDIIDDAVCSSTSMTWHHTIDKEGPEVTATAFFFNQMITRVLTNRYRSYIPSKNYGSQSAEAKTSTLTYIPIVYMESIPDDALETLFSGIRTKLTQSWVHQWPGIFHSVCVQAENKSDTDSDGKVESSDNEYADESMPDYGHDISHCVINHFAVERSTFVNNVIGIKVHKVVSVANIDADNYYNFDGMEYICTIHNTHIDCIRAGMWNYNSTISQRSQVYSWSVIAYFESLTVDRRLPDTVVRTILNEHARMSVFNN